MTIPKEEYNNVWGTQGNVIVFNRFIEVYPGLSARH